ncbi:MAG TPA: metal-dependent hydrolase [Longimicrobiaceae bacterium]|nr:metal-dependent hydrolase [Longimicrobiaceae bacterium]
MAFPPAHMLVGVGMAEVVRSVAPLPRWRAWAVAAGLAVLPDMDLVLGIALRRGVGYHGTFTHSVAAVVVIALLAGVAAGGRWAVLAGAGYGSHLVVDLMDDRGRTNVLLGWPFTDERPFAIARIFPQVPSHIEEGLKEAVLSLFSRTVIAPLSKQTAMGAAFFVALVFLAWIIRQARGAPMRGGRTR